MFEVEKRSSKHAQLLTFPSEFKLEILDDWNA